MFTLNLLLVLSKLNSKSLFHKVYFILTVPNLKFQGNKNGPGTFSSCPKSEVT